MTTTFSFLWSEPLDKAVKEQALAQCPEGFKIETSNPEEYSAISQAWNQGIDSHLEALTEKSSMSQANGWATFLIHPEELHVLVRRLLLSEADLARDLAGCFCESLNITLI